MEPNNRFIADCDQWPTIIVVVVSEKIVPLNGEKIINSIAGGHAALHAEEIKAQKEMQLV